MRIRDAMGVGMSGETAKAVAGTCSSVTAAGSTQNDAASITTANTFVSSAAADTGVILPSDAEPGDTYRIGNGGGNALDVYPPSGGQINGDSANAPKILADGVGAIFTRIDATNWIATGTFS